MSAASGDTTQDLSLPLTPAREEDATRDSPTHSGLSLDDLSSADGGRDNVDGAGCGADTSCNSRRVELRLQRNLRRQQEHFARQRRLFDDLRGDSVAMRDDDNAAGGDAAMSPSVFSSSSRSSSDSAAENDDRRNRTRARDEQQKARQRQERESARNHVQLEHELTGIALSRQSTATRPPSPSPSSTRRSDTTCLRSDKDAIRELSRIKVKAISDYERRMAETRQKQSRRLRPTTAASPAMKLRRQPASTALRPDFVEELSQQEASNEALRKQLELLRRLQVENNRFRHENRVCREQNEVLEEQNQSQRRELKRLREDIAELAIRVEQDQQRLATAAHTSRKLKSCQKQLSEAHDEIAKLRAALQETLELHERSRAQAASDRSDLSTEIKRLKRSLKQATQQEVKCSEENELLRGTVEALESELNRLKSEIHVRKRDTNALSSQLEEKSSQCEAIEASATACVQRMEAGMENLQKALDGERERRKKLEAQRRSLQAQIATLEADGKQKQQQIDAREHHVEQLQECLTTKKLELQECLKSKKLELQECMKTKKLELQECMRAKRLELQKQRDANEEQVRELLAKHKQDQNAIDRLRDECESAQQQQETERAAALDAKKRVGAEIRKVRREIEGLRGYIESSLQSDSNDSSRGSAVAARAAAALSDGANSDAGDDLDAERSSSVAKASRPNHQTPPPELQFLQGATSALRTEAMSFVHEYQRARHALTQQAKQLGAALERVTELERLRSEDATKIKDLREQRALSEQARDIASKEKLEVLKWSQQMCEKSEALEEELDKCGRFVQSVLQRLRHRRESNERSEGEDGDAEGARGKTRRRRSDKSARGSASPHPFVSQHFAPLESEVELLLSTQQTLQQELEQASHERSETASELQALRRDLESKAEESERMLAEVEALHSENAREQKLRFEAAMSELERDKHELARLLRAANAEVESAASDRARLETLVAGLEADLPVLATILHLFVLVVQPLVLQVSELLAQKRFLLRENAEYAQSQEQVECIAQVLKELVPMDVGLQPLGRSERQLHRRFRRVVVAVFALNRFQRCSALQQQQLGDSSRVLVDDADDVTSDDGRILYSGSFGVCTSLKPPRKRRAGSSESRVSMSSSSLQRNPPPTAIRVLAPRANVSLRTLLERLRSGGITEKAADVIAMGGPAEAASHLGSLLVQVLAAIDPSAKESLLDNTSGVFHCQALLERRHRRRHHKSESDLELLQAGSELSTVDVIRKRILALGKRVEDLHYQRNALQKDNYELQFQLEQQATRLQQMEHLVEKTSELESELQELRAQNQRDHEAAQQEIGKKVRELESKEREARAAQEELAQADVQIERLQSEVARFQEQLEALDTEKQELHTEVTELKLASVEEEEKAEVARAGAKKQEEEVRNLKQAARKAHELYQKVTWQLEQEVGERAKLQASADLLKRQKENLETELRGAKLRDVEKSFELDASKHHAAASLQRKKQQQQQHRVRFAATEHQDDESPHASPESSSFDSSGGDRKGTPELVLEEDACLYHRFVKPSNTAARAAARDPDSSSDQEKEREEESSSTHPSSFRLELPPRSSSDAHNKFLDEWRRLQLASAFDDGDESSSRPQHQSIQPTHPASDPMDLGGSRPQHSITTTSAAAGATSRQIARATEIQSNRRRIEIDKVNSAVHDYMDRIDEKLQQMYGIPPSSASSSRSQVGEKRTSGSDDDGDDDQDGSEVVSGERVATSAQHHRAGKANETREVHWFG